MKSITKDHFFRLLCPEDDPEYLPGRTALQKGPEGQRTLVFEDPTVGAFFAIDYKALKDSEGNFQIDAPTFEEGGEIRLPVRQVVRKDIVVTKWVPVEPAVPASEASN